MSKGRKSIVVNIGRIFQTIPPFFFSWIEIFFYKKDIKRYPFIVVISTPRSGSTLTYQILSRGTKSVFLTNLWNLLYALPLIGGIISKRNENNNEEFSSDRGLVSGIYGEAEGLKFWQYWSGQGLEETDQKIPIKRVKYLRRIFGSLLKNDLPMMSGYLGHSLSINNLRKIFPGILFIYLKRDKLSNIYSMYNTGNGFDWFSLKPKGWEQSLSLPIHERFVWQYNKIVDKIESEISDKDTLVVNYEDICENPKQFLNDVKTFSSKHNINLKLTLQNIPDSFNVRKIDPNQDEDSKIIHNLLQNE
ncbi:MAG: hypothetical protein HN427_05995 [Flavobacteriales bacterium]|jgi:hypothetical protein|nr:hypothetical protein [Flavobacteriales bacterium]MBT6014218.1 hypothetical protein [Flavobacteriales bacterium]